MSRKSHAFASGQPAFSWRVESILEASGETRFKVTCRNKPEVFAIAETEQKAIRAAQAKMEVAVDRGDVGMVGPGQL